MTWEIFVAQWQDGDREWLLVMQNADGTKYLSRDRYKTKKEAETAAQKWATENMSTRVRKN